MFEIDRLTLPPIGTNCYILTDKNTKHSIVIDPAYNGKGIFDYCVSKGYSVTMIVLTHGHFDHIGGVDELVNYSNAKVYIHKSDFEMLADADKNGSNYFLDDTIVSNSRCVLMDDDCTIEFAGESIKTVHTPGHTKGSVVLVSSNAVFTGDTLMEDGVGRTDLYGGNAIELRNSLMELYPLLEN